MKCGILSPSEFGEGLSNKTKLEKVRDQAHKLLVSTDRVLPKWLSTFFL